ncbi:UNVERIFIED_CONTAM: Oligopeptide transporter 1 [Sesamum radiatum]|uniref:Oligopeptide transporter 1 n=1 Tax=Sesamum radiatum TaxID=300843 RepID=A0AAW2K2Z3_SESRA
MAGGNDEPDHKGDGEKPEKPHTNLVIAEVEEENDSPIEQVRLTVPATDDPSLPVLTFRTWCLGLIFCVLLAFLNQFFSYRQNALYIYPVTAQIITLPLGRFMARVLPTRKFTVPLTKWSFSLNPGPFNLKEHVLISIFANCGSAGVYAVAIITTVKAFYHRQLHPLAAFMLAQTTQMLGYGWAGIFRRILVDSPYMWWPENMVAVSLFRALHEEDVRPKGGLSRLQFFLVVFVSSFAYYLVPAYLFPTISSISVLCLIWKNSIFPQQLGSGVHGMGIGSFALDWSAVVGFISNPISSPGFAIVNTLVGFFLVMYVMLPLTYFNNVFDAKKFPIFSPHTFDQHGKSYNISRVLNHKTFNLDMAGYEGYSKLYLSVFFAFTYGLGFASLSATITHVALHHGKFWQTTSTPVVGAYNGLRNGFLLHSTHRHNTSHHKHGSSSNSSYLSVAQSVFLSNNQEANSVYRNLVQQIGLNIITEMIIGYIYPGRPLANVAFKTYGYISMSQALGFLSDFKLGTYMKIPPKSMFIAQLGGCSQVSTTFATHGTYQRGAHGLAQVMMFYNASIIWGVIGPLRMFTGRGVYGSMNWWFLVGAILPIPVYLLARKYPEKKWIQLINVPLILGSTMSMPPARAVNFIMWGAVGIFFNIYIYRVQKKWWARHAYILAAALNAGIAFMGVLLYFTLQMYDVSGPSWWGLDADDHCPLAQCPTVPGVNAEGCPVL